ncbi:MAG TPA: hypothetical protein VFX45_04265 [Solirubrobacterales bacterium]|nr:hypothetical protein [Solirubrobacterales bacterium]
MSRFRIFVLLAAIAALATPFAACGGSGSEDPQQVVDDATLEGVESGDLDLSLSVKAEGEKSGNIDLSLSGPFQSQGKGDLPLADVTLAAKGDVDGEPVDFDGSLTLLADRAFVGYEGTEYEVDPTTFGFVKSGFEQAQQQGGSQNSADLTACQEAAEGLEIADFVENVTSEGGEDVEGTSTTKVSADLNAEGAIDAIIQLTEAPACKTQLEAAGPLPLDELEEAKRRVPNELKKAHVDLYVGDDNIIRRAVAEVIVVPKDGSGKVEVDLDLTLSGVNEEQEIAPPSGAEPLEGLFKELGIDPLELLEEGPTGGISALLEKLTDGLGGSLGGDGGSSGGGSSGGGSADDPAAYLECLQDVETAADLQKCASLQ